ncbi:ferredoxin [Williamsia maris]|uniref:Ferredoxin n=1 Tax=Williamsia maris TaxID=72806 RepID=A0ABT1HDT7_9NOCA|nr:ferredoxin [Williamsia maris]MCP2176421.1 Ferredoxin [Williamsia maris]
MRVTLDQDKCVGSGQCITAAPEVFDQRDDDGISFVVDPDPPATSIPEVEQAAAVCPALAIRLLG